MREVNYSDYINLATQKMAGDGVLLTSGSTPNTMTMGWGSIGFFWAKPVFIAPVRHSRFTHGLITESGEFTVSVPLSEKKEILTYCGKHSGRDGDKFATLGLKAITGIQNSCPMIEGFGLHFECKTRMTSEVTEENLSAELVGRIYSNHDFHTLFFGEIVGCWLE